MASSKIMDSNLIGMGWTSPDITSSSFDALMETLIDKARSPEKYMDVSNVKVADRVGFLARSMVVNASSKKVEEHIYVNEEKGEIIYRVVDGNTKRETDDEKVMAVKQSPLRIEFFHRHVQDGYRKFWPAPVSAVQKMLQEILAAAKTINQQSIVGLGVESDVISGVSHDTMWRALIESIREPQRFFQCSNVQMEDKMGKVQRTLTASGQTYSENIFVNEHACELAFRKLENGSETGQERVIALRTHPMTLEFHQRSTADGFRVSWDMPRAVPLQAVDAYVREAKRMDGAPPSTVGYGITSDPITGCSYDSLLVAVQTSIKQPWRAISVDESSCDVKDCNGYVERRMRLTASGEVVTERIVVNEEMGEVSFNKCDKYGTPGPFERVMCIHTPLRLEFYQRSVNNGVRTNWSAPYDIARQTFDNIIQMGRKLESKSSDVVGFGVASKPVTGLTQDDLWKAMLYAARNPDKSGMKVDNVVVRDMQGFMQRSMRLLGKSGQPTLTDNIRVVGSAQEIVYCPVSNGSESQEQRVFALRTEPLRMELFCRQANDGMRIDWQAPLAVANEVFNAVTGGGSGSDTKVMDNNNIGMGWTSPEITAVTYDGLWESLVDKARSPEKYMDVSEVKVADRQGFLARSMFVKAKGKRVEEHIYASERKGEIIYRVVDSITKRETDDEKVMALKTNPLRIEFFHRHVTDGYRKFWPTAVSVVQNMLDGIIAAGKVMDRVSGVVGLGVQSDVIQGVSHDAMWRSMLTSVREPQRFYTCSAVQIQDQSACVQRTLTTNGKTFTENVYTDESSCELTFRRVDNGVETDMERVIVLRTHPMTIEFHQRNKADGFRVNWDMPRNAPLDVVNAFVTEAKRLDGVPPTTIGYGITSDPITGCAYDSLLVAVQTAIRQPWKVIGADESSCTVKDCNGYVERRMRLIASGEVVTERIVVNEESGEVAFNKCDKYGMPGSFERVLCIHTPLRLEFYQRNVSNGVRTNWAAPYDIARQTFDNMIQLGRKLESNSSDVIGFGLASKPVVGMTQDGLWRAMLNAVRNPDKSGMKVDNVVVRDMQGFMQRSMRLLGKSGQPTVTDNIRVVESAQEIVYCPTSNSLESEERVFALRTEPLRMELFCRQAKDGMRTDWQAPLAVANEVFNSVMGGSSSDGGMCPQTGLETGGNALGGALNASHVAHLDGVFVGGLHKPTWDPEGLHKPHTIGGKTYETGFHYLLEAHELGGKNTDGGFGGPLCKDPYSPQIQALCQTLVDEAQRDKTLCYNNFSDPCPALTKRQAELCKGFDFGNKTLKLPCGPLPWPAGLPHPGYVPKSNPLNGRWITASGGQKEFIKAAIADGMLGAAEAKKIVADTDHEQTGGMYLRINQRGETCTVDASVAKYARAKRTWKSGHYFYEPLVSGGNLMGVWVLPEEYRKIGFFWEMDSGKCFRIERRAFERDGLMILRQATEVKGKTAFVFYIKVSNDPESQIIPVQSRDFTALAGHDNVCDNLGNPYPCIAKDLDYPVKRDTWLDKNEDQMLKQRDMVSGAFAHCCEDGFEAHDNAEGGPLNAAHVEALGKEHFKDGLHQPDFHPDGLHMPMKAGGKVYETAFHYLLEAHEAGGKSADGGYGGPLCADPYSPEIKRIVDNLLAQSEVDRTLAFDNFSLPCPVLTKQQTSTLKGFDYGDKTLKLPCGPLPWPAGTPPPGYKPKTNPLTGRWITVSGGQSGFIKESIKAGMLGAAEAKKIMADTDHEKTGGMYLRITQFADQCTVDASIAKYARAKRTWRSGHYFYEPLVSGGNLMGVWVLPEEYRKIGFFWEMDSGHCFRIERRAYPVGPLMVLRQSTEVNGKISFVFYIKCDNDPGSNPIPVQSRDYTALAGQDNVCDNLGNPYPCTGKDLDFPKKRDAWLDTNKEAMLDQRGQVSTAFANVCEKGFEVGDHADAKGGPVNGAQLAKFGDNFKNGLHQPNFSEEGLHAPMEVSGKKYDSGFHYLLEAHELGGKNTDGGYGGPLCRDPYGAEVQGLVEKLLKEADDDKTLCYNNFQDPCPLIAKEKIAKLKGYDYGDKTKILPCGPLPWPAGCPEPGYVPKTNPLTGRWITVSGGQAAFIKEAIASGMLGQSEAHKIMADTDHEQTGGMYLRINQLGDTCTVDASVAKYARAKRTWKSGHYFYEPLVSGGNLMGVWVLPEEYRKIGFFYEMDSGRCFRIERRAFPAGPYTFLRQSTEVNGKISFVLYVKCDNDPGSMPTPVQSRDYTALAGQDNVCTNLGKPYPCTAKDLDYPKKRDTWLDTNKAQMMYQRDVVANTFKEGATQ